MNVCVGCVYEYIWREPLTAIPEGCKGCKVVDGKPSNYKPKPQTNADRIRAMSDEELCEFLYKKAWLCESHRLCVSCPKYHIEKGCLSTEEWLKQPAEE